MNLPEDFDPEYATSSFTTRDGERIMLHRLPSNLACIPSNPHVEALRQVLGIADCTVYSDALYAALIETARAVAFQSDMPVFNVDALRRKLKRQIQ